MRAKIIILIFTSLYLLFILKFYHHLPRLSEIQFSLYLMIPTRHSVNYLFDLEYLNINSSRILTTLDSPMLEFLRSTCFPFNIKNHYILHFITINTVILFIYLLVLLCEIQTYFYTIAVSLLLYKEPRHHFYILIPRSYCAVKRNPSTKLIYLYLDYTV